MRYADTLRGQFPGLDPEADDLFLLEAHQVAQLPDRAPDRELAAVLHARPRLRRFLVARCPPIEEFLRRIAAEHGPVGPDELAACEDELMWEIADWVVYQRAPDRLDVEPDEAHDPCWTAISDVAAGHGVDLHDQVVVDAGAGTGRLTFLAAPTARHVFAVEPVAALRRHVRERAARQGIGNVFVLDGCLDQIPLPAATADVLMTRQAIGWRLDAELREVERVTKVDGLAIHLLGMPAPAPPGDELDPVLSAHGYRPGTYDERGVVRRLYVRRFET